MCSRFASTEKRRLAALVLGDRDLVIRGEGEQLGARVELPFAPRRDHPDVGIEGVVGELEADLVVALAGGAVGDGIGAGGRGDLDLALGDQRPGDRCAEQIDALIERVGAEHREHVVAHEDVAQVFDEDLLDPGLLGLGPRRFQLLALAEVGGEGHDLAAVPLLQPTQDDGGVKAARIRQHHFLDAVAHGRCLSLGSPEAAQYRGCPGPGKVLMARMTEASGYAGAPWAALRRVRSLVDLSWPQAARMSSPRGVRIGEA